MEMEMLNSN